MIGRLSVAALLAIAFAAPAAAQQPTGALQPQGATVVAPLVPPATAVTQVAPGIWQVTPVPGIAMATHVRVQNFADYDLNHDGVYNPMEFAQAMYFLATSDPVAGNPRLPAMDRFVQRGAPTRMRPENAVALLNATADEFAAVDMNHDGRVSPAEVAGAAM
ncbi:MAG: hypothetical protein E6G94_10105 [Alphaproteobacteria bacterium]|nr:MAG: hypothetical protein E6G94_10105 [Alphaproteobacteria bacterium]